MMHTPRHDDERLSAYLDGELEAAERASIDAHLVTCPGCREVLAALRATRAELSALPEPEPRPEDSWAVRAAVARARRRRDRFPRFAVAASGVAAAIIAFAVIATRGGPPPEFGFNGALRGATPLLGEDTNYTRASAEALLATAVFSNQTEAGGAGATDALAPTSKGAESGPAPQMAVPSAATPLRVPNSEVSRCETQIFKDAARPTPLRYIAARYEGKAALLLLYRVEGTKPHRELWVLARSSCDVLFFAQRAG